MKYSKLLPLLLGLLLLGTSVSCTAGGNTPTENTQPDTEKATEEAKDTETAPETDAPAAQAFDPTLLRKIGKAELLSLTPDMYMLRVPFSGIFTSVIFVRTTHDGWAILDAATTAEDINEYVVKAAEALEVDLATDVKTIGLTHSHGDHAGGIPTLAALCKSATVYGLYPSNPSAGPNYKAVATDGQIIAGDIRVIFLRGHDYDCCGFLDIRTGTMYTGDSCQLYGVSVWGTQVRYVQEYRASMKKLLENEELNNIVTAHNNCPTGYFAAGKEECKTLLNTCLEAINDLVNYTYDYQVERPNASAEEIQRAYLADRRDKMSNFPINGFTTAINVILQQKPPRS